MFITNRIFFYRSFIYLKSILSLFKKFLSKSSENGINEDILLSKFAPVLCKPKQGQYLSIQHNYTLPAIIKLLRYYLHDYNTLFDV